MNYLIQRGKIRSQVINVPEGLPEILSDITREVLRCQPTTECLCQFIIDYLHSVIVARENARMAKRVIDRALRTVDEIIADMCVCDIHRSKADKMCEAMEQCFKRFLAQRRCEKGKNIEIIKFNEVDMLDELIQQCKFSEDELKISRPIIEAAYQKFVDAYMTAQENPVGTDALYQYFRDREMKRMEERIRHESALKIQANFRGFLVRRSLFLNKDVDEKESSELSEDLLEQEVAARKIQRFFRRHMSFIQKQAEMTSGENFEFQDICMPESRVSLTAHTPGQNDLGQETIGVDQFDDRVDVTEVEQHEENRDDIRQELPEEHQDQEREDHQYVDHHENNHEDTKEVRVNGQVDHSHEESNAMASEEQPADHVAEQ